MPSEIWIYFSIPLASPHLILFFVLRYTTLISITLGLYSTWHRQTGDCVAYSEVATLLVQLSVSAVLGWRTIAIWQRDARIIVVIALLLFALMLFSSLLVLSMKPSKLRNGTCVLVEGGNYPFFPLAWFYAGTVLYDTIVIVLSTYRLWQHHNDVGVFPGANKERLGWGSWVHSQWNSITPLLFRLTSNGVLYLAFSTVFNVVCFIVGHWNEDHAQDLMLLYCSVMWVVCQHMVLLEIRATWGDTAAGGRLGRTNLAGEETDKLIAQLLQASWSRKPPPSPPDVREREPNQENQDPEVEVGLPMDSCLWAAPSQTARRQRSKSFGKGVEEAEPSVQQIHDFRPCESYLAPSIAASDRPTTAASEGNTSVTPILAAAVSEQKSPFRHRFGALCKRPSSRSQTLDHPLVPCSPSSKQQRRTSSSLERLSRSNASDFGTARRPATATGAIPSLEVADMIANMSDEAKFTALALAGMDGGLEIMASGSGSNSGSQGRSRGQGGQS